MSDRWRGKKGLGVLNGSFWAVMCEGAIAFLISLKGQLKKKLGNPGLDDAFYKVEL